MASLLVVPPPVPPTPVGIRQAVFLDSSGHWDYPKTSGWGDGDTEYYTIVGVAVSPQQQAELEAKLTKVVADAFPKEDATQIEIHTVAMSGSHREWPWSELPGQEIPKVFSQIRDAILEVRPLAFGQVLRKAALKERYGENAMPPYLNANHFLLNRIDRQFSGFKGAVQLFVDDDNRELKRAFVRKFEHVQDQGDALAANWPFYTSKYDCFQHPEFISSNDSRCMQTADFIAYWTQRAAEHQKANRIREMDAVWRRFTSGGRSRREPLVGFAPDRDLLLHQLYTREPTNWDQTNDGAKPTP